jgi:hypothetical protein
LPKTKNKQEQHMITYGTEHLSADVFNSTYKAAQPGDQIIYAVGDLATSRSIGPEGMDIDHLGTRVMHLAEHGFVCLTQRALPELRYRNGGGRCFEYIATKCQPKNLVRTPSPRSFSLAGEPATA